MRSVSSCLSCPQERSVKFFHLACATQLQKNRWPFFSMSMVGVTVVLILVTVGDSEEWKDSCHEVLPH